MVNGSGWRCINLHSQSHNDPFKNTHLSSGLIEMLRSKRTHSDSHTSFKAMHDWYWKRKSCWWCNIAFYFTPLASLPLPFFFSLFLSPSLCLNKGRPCLFREAKCAESWGGKEKRYPGISNFSLILGNAARYRKTAATQVDVVLVPSDPAASCLLY